MEFLGGILGWNSWVELVLKRGFPCCDFLKFFHVFASVVTFNICFSFCEVPIKKSLFCFVVSEEARSRADEIFNNFAA